MPDRLANYVPVAERVSQAQDAIKSVAADAPVMLTDAMGYIRVTVTLLDERSATGTASFRLDLQGKSAQATNPIEDCETSAIGRALAFLGYESARGIASREEVHEAQRRSDASYDPHPNGSGNGAGITDKQLGMLRGKAKAREWGETELLNFAADHGIRVQKVANLSARQASTLIDALMKSEQN